MIEGSGAGSVPRTNGSGSGRPRKHIDPTDPDLSEFLLRIHIILIVKQQEETTGQPFVFTNIFITMHYVKKYLLLLLPLVLLEEAEDHADRFSFPEAVREEGR